jgi:hypothetical protein
MGERRPFSRTHSSPSEEPEAGYEALQQNGEGSPKEIVLEGVVRDQENANDTVANLVEDEHSCLICCEPVPESEVFDSPGVYRMKRPPIVDDVTTPLPRRVREKCVKLSVSRRH